MAMVIKLLNLNWIATILAPLTVILMEVFWAAVRLVAAVAVTTVPQLSVIVLVLPKSTAIVTVAVYLIPHSMAGSQLDYDAVDRGVTPEEAIGIG